MQALKFTLIAMTSLLVLAGCKSEIKTETTLSQLRYLSSFFSRNFPKKSLSIIQLPGRRPGP